MKIKNIIFTLIQKSLEELSINLPEIKSQLKSSIQEVKPKNFKSNKDHSNNNQFLLSQNASTKRQDYYFGDYAFCSFSLCKSLKQSPQKIIHKIYSSSYFQKNFPKNFSKVTLIGGYLNFFLDKKKFIQDNIFNLLQKKSKYSNQEKTFLFEYSSPNIAKPLSIAHLRSTIIGQSLSNLFEYLNYKVIRINYPGDWGTPFGGMVYAYQKYIQKRSIKKLSVKFLYRLYLAFNKKKELNPKLNDIAKKYFKKLEANDPNAIKIWEKIKEVSLKEFESIYKKLNVHFDHYFYESDSSSDIPNLLKEIKEKNLIKKSKNASIIDLKPWNLNVAMLQKDDQTSLYITRDIISAKKRYDQFHFDKMIYVTGSEQNLHFQQLFKILELLYPNKINCEHVSFGLMKVNQKKLSSRKGHVVFLKDLIKSMQKTCYQKLLEKKTTKSMSHLKKRSLKLAISSIIFADLKNNRTNNISFNIEEIINPKGNTGTYLQYTYARTKSLIKKFEAIFCPLSELLKKEIQITEESGFFIIKKLCTFDSILEKAAEKYNPSILAKYVIELCKEFSQFYQQFTIINQNNMSNTYQRILIVYLIQKVLNRSLKLLCIKPIDKI